MKKVLIFISLLIGLLVINQEVRSQQYLDYPFGAADYQAVTPGTGVVTTALTVTNEFTYVNYGTIDTVLTINVTIDAGVRQGAILIIKAKSDATARDITLGTGIDGPTFAGVISKTKMLTCFYDGTKFLALNAGTQID